MTYATTLKLGVSALLAATLLSACAGGPELVPAGKLTLTASPAYTVAVDRDWSDASKLFYNRAQKVRVLSIDGVLLNRLFVSEGLTADDPLMVNPQARDTPDHPAPHGKADMSLSEQMEFVAGSLGQLEYQKVETSNPQPVMVGTVKGVRFEFTARTTEGLNMKGMAQAVSSKGFSYYIVYIAPAEHYYGASLKNAIATMDSAKL